MARNRRGRKTSQVESLLSRRAVGGSEGWSGFTGQLWYIVTQFPQWFLRDGFRAFSPERDEDVDVFYADGASSIVDYHQVKTGTQTPGSIKEIVASFAARHQDQIANGSMGRLIVATPSLSERVRGAGRALARFREAHFTGNGDPQLEATLADLRQRLVGGRIVRDVDFQFAVDHLQLLHDWGGLEPDQEPWGRIAGEIGRLPEFQGNPVAELEHAAKELAHAIQHQLRHPWTREKVVALLSSSIMRLRAGPPKGSGDFVLLCHQSLAPIRKQPDLAALPESLRARRGLLFIVDQCEVMVSRGWDGLAASVAGLFDPASLFQQALAKARSAPVIYYGFPHIPFAALAGYLLGDPAEVYLIDHDRDTRQVAWPDVDHADSYPDLTVRRNRVAAHGAVVVRVSISASVAASDCVIPLGEPVAEEIDFGIADPMRGTVRSEPQARAYGKTIRQALDRIVGGNPSITRVHVFAAVPVSIAFLIGQVSASTGYPEVLVYNFRSSDAPRYRWALNLRAAHTGGGIVFLDARTGESEQSM